MSFFRDSAFNPWFTNNLNETLDRSIESMAVTGFTNAFMTGALGGLNQLLNSQHTSFVNGVGGLNQILNSHHTAFNKGMGGINQILEEIKRSNDSFTNYVDTLNNTIKRGNESFEDYVNKLNKSFTIVNEESPSYRNKKKEILNTNINSIYEESTSEEKGEIDAFVRSASQAIEVTHSQDGIIIFFDTVKQIVRNISESKILGLSTKGWLLLLIQGIIVHYTTQYIATSLSSNSSSIPQITQYQAKITEVQHEINNAVFEMQPVVTATTVVHLRGKPNKKSKILLKVQEGQDVKVIEEKFKWMYVSVKGEDGCFIEGWTYKEYYE